MVQYNFSTAEESTDQLMLNNGIFGNMMDAVNRTTSGPMHGYGFGLSMSKAYAEYLGGSIQIVSMQDRDGNRIIRLSSIHGLITFLDEFSFCLKF